MRGKPTSLAGLGSKELHAIQAAGGIRIVTAPCVAKNNGLELPHLLHWSVILADAPSEIVELVV